MQNTVLEVKNLTKQFGLPTGGPPGEFTAIDNISFSLKDGEILGLPLNILYLTLALYFFVFMFNKSKKLGLGRLI